MRTSMRKLLEVTLGGGRIHSGMLPVDALQLMKDLLAALEEQGGDPESWRAANPHVEIVGRSSTLAAVHAEEYQELLPPAELFVHKAEQRNLGPKGREFVERQFKPSSTWDYALVSVCNEHPVSFRFDSAYRSEIREESHPLVGIEEMYARVVRVGGEDRITTRLEMGRLGGTYKVANVDTARDLAARLYETVKIRAQVKWDTRTLEVEDLTVLSVDTSWRDVHLAEVIKENGGVLPLELSVKSTEELNGDG